jgi:hypothetical protein
LRPTYGGPHYIAAMTLREEIDERQVDLTQAVQALDAAEDLLPYPRDQWAQPSNAWERLVVAMATSVVRVEGHGIPRPAALAAVREAARAMGSGARR